MPPFSISAQAYEDGGLDSTRGMFSGAISRFVAVAPQPTEVAFAEELLEHDADDTTSLPEEAKLKLGETQIIIDKISQLAHVA